MKYDELKALTQKQPLEQNLVGAFPIHYINKFISDSEFDTIYTPHKLLKELTYQTNKYIVDYNFEKLLYHLSTTNLDFDETIVALKKLLGGFDIKNNKFYCVDGREFKLNILEEAPYGGEIFLMRDDNVVIYINTCGIYD